MSKVLKHRLSRIAGVVIVAALAGWLVAGLNAGTGPVLMVDQAVWEVDDVPASSTVTHTFTLTNTSDQPIQITAIRSNCSCTTGQVAPNPIPPGSTAEVTAELRVPTRGPSVSSSVVLETDAPSQPRLVLTMRANLAAVVVTEPDRLVWTLCDQADCRERRVRLARLDDKPLGEVQVLERPQGVSVELRQETPSRYEAILRVEQQPNEGEQAVVFSLGVPGYERMTVPVQFIHRRPFRLLPSSFLLKETGEGASVMLYGLDGAGIDTVEVLQAPHSVDVDVQIDAEKGRAQIVARPISAAGGGGEAVTLRVRVGYEQHRVTVPLGWAPSAGQ